MLVFFGDGRLGNQIFQWAFLNSIKKEGEITVVFNFKDFLSIFELNDNIINISNKYLAFFLIRVGQPFLRILSKVRFISSYSQNSLNSQDHLVFGNGYRKKSGLFSLTYVYPGYFQSQIFFKNKVLEKLKIREIYIEAAKSLFSIVPNRKNTVFVHIRRGDYVNWVVLGQVGATLPIKYYYKNVNWFKENTINPFFIFLTDDREFVELAFKDEKDKIISENHMGTDFAVMTLCSSGILSNSSFSWWGAYLMVNRETVIFPEYWLGFKSLTEYPIGVIPDFAKISKLESWYGK